MPRSKVATEGRLRRTAASEGSRDRAHGAYAWPAGFLGRILQGRSHGPGGWNSDEGLLQEVPLEGALLS